MSRTRSTDVPADVVSALDDLGIEVTKVVGDEAWALCPAHSERNPSWSINLDTGLHSCFSCGFSGNFIVLLKWIEKHNDETARAWIRSHGGFEAAKKKFKGDTLRREKEVEPVSEADLALFTDPPQRAREEKGVSLAACRKYGVRWNAEKQTWIFPVRDPFTGELRGWQEKNKRVFINYPKHGKKKDCLFGWDVVTCARAIVVESPIDPVYLDTLGFDGGVATMGVNISDEQLSLLAEGFREVVFALDNDKSGEVVSRKIHEKLRGRVRYSFFNYGTSTAKDPGEMSRVGILWGLTNAISSVRIRFADN